MEKFFTDLLEMLVGLVQNFFGVTITVIQMAVIIVTILLVLLILTAIRLSRKTKQLKTLKKQIINKQIQVVTVAQGNKGKSKQVIRTQAQLRNPKRNKMPAPKRSKPKGVTNIKED